jgi:hypothetical protein
MGKASAKTSGVEHRLAQKRFNGKLYERHDSYNWKSDVNQRAKWLQKDGFSIRTVSTPLEGYRYTLYKRKK